VALVCKRVIRAQCCRIAREWVVNAAAVQNRPCPASHHTADHASPHRYLSRSTHRQPSTTGSPHEPHSLPSGKSGRTTGAHICHRSEARISLVGCHIRVIVVVIGAVEQSQIVAVRARVVRRAQSSRTVAQAAVATSEARVVGWVPHAVRRLGARHAVQLTAALRGVCPASDQATSASSSTNFAESSRVASRDTHTRHPSLRRTPHQTRGSRTPEAHLHPRQTYPYASTHHSLALRQLSEK
jgi:hypothetical protein